MEEYNFNHRGMLIVPTDKEQIQVYLCALDVPSGFSASDFTQLKIDDKTVWAYSCNQDSSGANTRGINPNSARPPVVKLQANSRSGYKTTNFMFQCATTDFQTDYFLVVIGSTRDEEQNYSNALQSMVVNDAVVYTSAYEGGGGAVTIISAPTQYITSQVGDRVPSVIEWCPAYKI